MTQPANAKTPNIDGRTLAIAVSIMIVLGAVVGGIVLFTASGHLSSEPTYANSAERLVGEFNSRFHNTDGTPVVLQDGYFIRAKFAPSNTQAITVSIPVTLMSLGFDRSEVDSLTDNGGGFAETSDYTASWSYSSTHGLDILIIIKN